MSETRGRSPTRRGTKRTRWGSKHDKVRVVTDQVVAATMSMGAQEREIYLLRLRISDITQKLGNVTMIMPRTENDRSPSPTPEYDADGVRTNTREQRLKEKLSLERDALLRRISKIDPSIRPSATYSKLTRVIPIPQEEFPEYNFVGLILGPRGNTQKRMERETGAKIRIKGQSGPSQGKGRHNASDDTNEPLHVLVSADDEESLAKAVKMIKSLVTPVEEDRNQHKQRQLRELASINGTLRSSTSVVCDMCGNRGHRINACPQRSGMRSGAPTDSGPHAEEEYASLMADLDP